MKNVIHIVIIIIFIVTEAKAQLSGVVNLYASVTAIVTSCQSTSFQLSSTTNFNNGDLVLIYQAKGATLVSGNSANSGSLVAVNEAGNYELNRIQSVSANRITFQFALKNSYSVSGLIQVVKVVEGTSLQLNGNIVPQVWNGRTGGIVAIKARSLSLNNFSISADFAGFRGGRRSINVYSPSLCGTNLYITDSLSGLSGERGESASEPFLNERYGRAPLWYGGGGGNAVNAGGGGGGNAGSGGRGGNEWIGCTNFQSNGGTGGTTITNVIQNDSTKLFFGGGGGGGQVNNFGGSAGGNGGGIVVIVADTLYAGGTSTISSLGQTSQSDVGSSGDGIGGGGAGGTVLLDTRVIQGTLNVNVRGGNSGNVSSNNSGLPCHGTGGGGGGGVLHISLNNLPALITFSAPGGTPGVNVSTNMNCNNTSFGAIPGNTGFVNLNRRVNVANAPVTQLQANLMRNFPDTVKACIGRTININGLVSTGTTVNWQGPSSFTSSTPNLSIPSFSLIQQGIYTAFADSSGCLDTISVAVIPEILPIIIPTIAASCFGAPINVNIQSENGVQYNWQLPNGLTFNTNNILGLPNSNSISGWWRLRRTSLSGCILIDSVFAPAPINQDLLFGFPDTINTCIGASFSVAGQSLTGITASWTGPSGFNSSGNQWSISSFQLANQGTYIGTASQGGCQDTVRVIVKTDLLPIFIPAFPTNPCPGDVISISVNNQPNVSFTWQLPNGQIINNASVSGQNYSSSIAGWWKLSALSQNGCTFIDSVFLPINNIKVDSVLFDKEMKACQDDTLVIPFVIPNRVITEYWNSRTNGYEVFSETITINGISFPPSPQSIYLRFTHLGCSKLDTILVTESDSCDIEDLFIPNVFTPNDDNLNQFFRAVGPRPVQFLLKVYNRWGQLIFETSNFDNGWNGETNGKPSIQGGYVYLIEYRKTRKSELIKRSGTFMLLR